MDILCKLGFHQWIKWFLDSDTFNRGSYRICLRCLDKQRQFLSWDGSWWERIGTLSKESPYAFKLGWNWILG